MKNLAIQYFRSLLLLTLLVAFLPHTAMAGNRTTLPICAAMSLKDAVTALQQIYEEQHPKIELEINFASSGALQKQIEQGAPAEVFLSAGQKQMNALETQGLIVNESRCDLLGNTLVLVVAREKQQQIKGFGDLQEHANNFAIGHPESVPAGRYGKQTLVRLHLWQPLEKRLVLAKNVRAVLAYVDSGNADAGLVYRTDTLKLQSAVIAAEAPVKSHAPIIYPAALVADGRHPAEAQQFLDFLQSDEAGKVFAKYRFMPLQNQP
ncbi:MAG: molybdate ABC transporter substrate-binding protein [Desulfuromonadaceae bacterium]|nr:molybdate ABC transporter substrate-binding protein [Desulfuromonadaceae bacterium]